MIFKCFNCNTMVDAQQEDGRTDYELVGMTCPICGCKMKKGCDLDCECNHTNVPGIKECPKCGEYVCPECGGHDVNPVSRVTGYLSPVNSWNEAKKEELRSRNRTQV